MTSKKFSEIEQAWYDKQHSVLGVKAEDYATEDRLYNFKAIAQLTGLTPLQACMVLRAKHTVALYEKVFKGEPISEEFFNEKAGDDANYLVLAKALHEEQKLNDNSDHSYYSKDKHQSFSEDFIEMLINKYYEEKDTILQNNPLFMTEMEEEEPREQQPKNLATVLAEELVKNGKIYAKMGTDAEKEAFIAERARQVMNDVFPSTKRKPTGSEHGGIIHLASTEELL